MVGYNFPFYEKGDRVLVYLTYDDDLDAYRNVYHYFKLVNEVVVDGHGFRDPAAQMTAMTEERLKEFVLSYVACTEPENLAKRADVVVIGAIAGDGSTSRITADGVLTLGEGPKVRVYPVSVEDVLKGSIPDSIQVVVHRYDKASWANGDSVLLFLRHAGAHYELVSNFAGHYHLRNDSAVGARGTFSIDELRSTLSLVREKR
jgi:hypothetical protein